MSDKRICVACGSEYKYCSKCGKYKNSPRWMWKCDKESCNEIFEVVSAYNMGIKTIEDVKDVVKTYDITDFSVYSQGIQNVLNTISNTTVSEAEEAPVEYSRKKKKKWHEATEEVVEPSLDIDLSEPITEAVTFEGISEE